MEENKDVQQAAKLLAWRTFARSAGIVTTAILTAIYLSPWDSFGIGILVWFFFYLIRRFVYEMFMTGRALDSLYDTCCLIPVYVISFWVTKWGIVVVAGLVAVNRGAPLADTAMALGGLLLYDLIVMIIWGA
jgi:hypothetical protein